MRRVLGDAVISLSALLILLLMLASVDERVRERVTGMLGGATHTSTLVGAGKDVSGLATVVYNAIKDQSVEHAPLVIFGLVATVLVVFMVRT